jgi:hypothetical protein
VPIRALAILLTVLFLTGCAGKAAVPSGGSSVNETFYKSDQEFVTASQRLLPGMTENQVFNILGHTKDQFIKMSREEIVSALYGGNQAGFQGSLQERENARAFLETLYGYKLQYKVVKGTMGFASPIRLRTDEKGVDYTLKMVFWQGQLFDRPALSGGPVKNSHSDTLFDYLNPFSYVMSAR